MGIHRKHWKPIEPVYCFNRRYTPCLLVLFNFIYLYLSILVLIRNCKWCTVRALIYIFIKILATFDTAWNFNIDVTIISHQECWIIWYNPSIIQPFLTHKYLVTIIPSSVYRICILSLLCGLTELFRVSETASTILHATTISVKNTTRAMHHMFAKKFVEKRVFLFIRKFCWNIVVKII